MNAAIQVNNVSKSFEASAALTGINLEVMQGERFGVIGPDGAGKSTLFRILATLLIPDEGNARVFEFDVVKDYSEIRKILGYMPGRFSLYQDLSVEENLSLFASLYGTTIEAEYEIIKDIYSQIEPFKDRKAGKLSGGMKQKLALSCALVHRPRLLILDEPTTGVDPVSRREFWDMLKSLDRWDITVIVSTPYMDEAMQCNRIALIQDGTILETNTPEEIVKAFPSPLFNVKSNRPRALIEDLRNYPSSQSVYAFGDSIHYRDIRDPLNKQALEEYLQSLGHSGLQVTDQPPGIEDCFMELMTRGNE